MARTPRLADSQGTELTKGFRVGSSFGLPDVILSLGQSPASVFAAAGVDLDLYSRPENRIAAEDLGRLFFHAAQATERDDIALLAVSDFRAAGLGLVGLLAAEGPDVDTALRNLVRLLRHNTLAGYPVLSKTGPTAMLKFDLRSGDFTGAGFVLEGATGIIFRFLQRLCGRSWKPEEVHLSRRAPPDPRPFQKFFGAPVRFSSTEDGVVFSSDWLSRPVAREEQRMSSRQPRDLAAPFSELVRRQAAIGLGFVSLDARTLSAELRMSRRQLFRHLKAEGTTCQEIVSDVKFSRARHLLEAGDAPIAEIAFALGYPDQSSFTRAFARWSGLPPNAWRKRKTG